MDRKIFFSQANLRNVSGAPTPDKTRILPMFLKMWKNAEKEDLCRGGTTKPYVRQQINPAESWRRLIVLDFGFNKWRYMQRIIGAIAYY
ncbi:hypothetical protein DSO57_1023003 [Entomophthora muscae]|uniref:Uncharacterized protein n=1 Tax=Entomophthora muscae TaxID=34485 RepID=A0ACC2SS34_9FUNG|nr:hypothetical protein DSO57_1023003 [Entomophthora muscae]